MMSQVASRREAAERRIVDMYGPVQRDIVEVEDLLRQELRSDDPFVDELVKYAFRIGGKRLRPALLLLSAKAIGQVSRDHIVLAAVVEMIHTATLVHDDVLDEASVRRHLDTVNARWNNESSVLLGDFLFTHSFYLASTLESTYACRTIGRATNIVCDGELRQVRNMGNYELGEEEYLQIIDAKTAELCACCCRLGAHYALSGQTEADRVLEERLGSFGRNLGIAFQIVDDLLDVVGDEATTGKSLGTDLQKHKATLPVIRLLELAPRTEREQLIALLNSSGPRRCEQLRTQLQHSGAIEYARAKARWYADQATADLADLPTNPSLEVLRSLTEFVVARQL